MLTETYMPVTRWLPVVGFEDRYEVSDDGQIRSLDRRVRCGKGKGFMRPLKGQLIKPKLHRGTYLVVELCKDSTHYPRKVHRLVLEAFVGPCPEGMECRHLNGDSLDNRLENLRWGTKSENMFDNVRNGTHHNARKTACPKCGGPYTKLRTGVRRCKACERARSMQGGKQGSLEPVG